MAAYYTSWHVTVAPAAGATAAAHHGGRHAAAPTTAVTTPTETNPVEKQQEAAAAASRGGFGRGSFGRGGNYGPSYWGRRLQGDAQPIADSKLVEQQQQQEAAAAANRGGFGRGSFGRGGNYGPSYWGRRLQGEQYNSKLVHEDAEATVHRLQVHCCNRSEAANCGSAMLPLQLIVSAQLASVCLCLHTCMPLHSASYILRLLHCMHKTYVHFGAALQKKKQ
jgi:hypothetical protein